MLDIFLKPQFQGGSIFSFAVFISALALLSIIYTVTDIRYLFRTAVAPIPLHRITFYLTALIGILTLLTDLWFGENWPIPVILNDQLIWQSVLGGIFFFLVLVWIYYAVINPPILSKCNYKKYFNTFYSIVLKGSDNELPILVNELGRSAVSIIILSKEIQQNVRSEVDVKEVKKYKPNAGDYANYLLSLIGNPKICHYIILYSPQTAITFFNAMTKNQKYKVPIYEFSKNIATEAIINEDSILYHEDKGYKSGLVGYLKPLSQALYGNYQLVEALAKQNGSPLDVSVLSWNSKQLEAYCRCTMITFESYINGNNWPQNSIALNRALVKIKNSCQDVYKLNNVSSEYSSDISGRLRVVVNFTENIVSFLDEQEKNLESKLRIRKHNKENFYDHIANLMFELIFSASSVNRPPDLCWSIHFVIIWFPFFYSPKKGKSSKIINHKLRRLLYDEISQLKRSPNYKSSRTLGICLNVMGLTLSNEKQHDSSYSLHKAILNWAKNNYLWLRGANLEVAESCLIGGISFDEQNSRLVKTYEKGLESEPYKESLQLLPLK